MPPTLGLVNSPVEMQSPVGLNRAQDALKAGF